MATVIAKPTFNDRYFFFLLVALGGHAIAGKAFAYIGLRPLFITEIVLVGGLLAMFQTGCVLASLLTVPSMLLAALVLLSIARTIPFIQPYGVEALRDSVLVLYAFFAFITASLLLQRPERLITLVGFLRWLTGVYVFVGPAIYVFSTSSLQRYVPWPEPGTVVPWVRAGEIGVHLSACAVMALVGLRSTRPIWVCGLALAIMLVASQNRGGFVAIMVPVAFALPFTHMWRRAIQLGMVAVLALGIGYAVDLEIPSLRPEEQRAGERVLGARQVVDNLFSLVGSKENKQLDDTKYFRVVWWQSIWDYTINGRYFWTGKGFGVNLAIDDGFAVSDGKGPPLRSPHNSHLNVLARTGIPGFSLWALFMVAWFVSIMGCARRAWRNGDTSWGNLLLLIACYWMSNIVNASFDVALEGPMLGTWYWCLTGFGLGVVAIYRAGSEAPGRVRFGASRPNMNDAIPQANG